MYEFHGWVNIWAADPDAGTLANDESAIGVIQAQLAQPNDDVAGWFEIRRTMNGQIVVVAYGLRNHRRTGALEVFRWIGERYPRSYGLLYVFDDEDPERGNEFVVYRLAHGCIVEFRDTVLSPVIP